MEVLNLSMVAEKQQARNIIPENEIEKSLLAVLDAQPIHIDEIQEKTRLPIEQVSATLTILELKGMVRQAGNATYFSIRENLGDYES